MKKEKEERKKERKKEREKGRKKTSKEEGFLNLLFLAADFA